MQWKPYIPDTTNWENAFLNKKYKQFYVVDKAKNLGENVHPVKLVSPAATTVEQARASMKRYHDEDDDDFDMEDSHPVKRQRQGIKKPARKRQPYVRNNQRHERVKSRKNRT